MPETTSPSSMLKVQGSSRLAFGATTAALVTLASGGTAVLVAHAMRGVTSPTSLPSGALPPDVAAGADGLVVDYPAGVPAAPAEPPAEPLVDRTEQALHEALTAPSRSRRRTLTAPLVPLAPSLPRSGDKDALGGGAAPVTVPTSPPVTPVTRHQDHATHSKLQHAHATHSQLTHSGGRHAAHGKGRHAR